MITIPAPGEVMDATEAKDIRLHTFDVDFSKMEGTFHARFDGVECPYPFPFQFDAQGWLCATVLLVPYHHTELMAMVQLPEGALNAMTRALHEIFPGIAPYRDGIGSARIWFKTPIERRLKSPHDIERFRALVGKKDFEYRLKF